MFATKEKGFKLGVLEKIDARLDSLERLKRELEYMVISLVMEEEALLVELNQRQLSDGVNSDGQKIKPGYTASTKRRKRRKGQPTSKVTLYDEGEHYAEILAEESLNQIFMTSSAPHARYLQKKYGLNIHGLTEGSIDVVRQKIKPKLIEEIRNYIS